MSLRRVLGGGVLVAILARRLLGLSGAFRQRIRFEMFIKNRVFGQRLASAIACNMRAYTVLTIHKAPECDFLKNLQAQVRASFGTVYTDAERQSHEIWGGHKLPHHPADNLHRFKQSIYVANDHEVERALIVHPEWVNTQRGGCLTSIVFGFDEIKRARAVRESTFRLLLQYRADVNRVDAYGCTALWYACCRGNCGLLNWNVQQGDVIRIDSFHLTFFESKVRLLLESRADIHINIPGFHGQTALMMAIRAADRQPDNVRLLLEYRADVEAKDERGQTALMIARSDKLVSLLLEYQADVNAADKQGNTALLLASGVNAIRDTSIVRVLLANQADVNAANMYGQTALKASFSSRNEPVCRLLLEQQADNGAIPARALLYAIEHSFDVSFMRTLIELRADVNARTSHGMSALMELLASSWPHHNSLCPLLLEYRADVNLVDQDGMSALMWASGFGNEECNMLNIPLLLKARADIDVKDQGSQGTFGTPPFPPRTALDWAIAKNHIGRVALLKSLGASQFTEGSHVCINGIVDRPALNGCTAKIVGPLDPANRSWPVRLVAHKKGVKSCVYHIPENMLLALSNLEPIQAESAEPAACAPIAGSVRKKKK